MTRMNLQSACRGALDDARDVNNTLDRGHNWRVITWLLNVTDSEAALVFAFRGND